MKEMSRTLVSLFLALLMTFSMAAVTAEDTAITVTDMFDRVITLPGPAKRVVVMEPGDCEILCALGCEEALVGRGLYCDYPESILALPALQSGASTNLEEVLALAPDVVIMSGMDHPREQVELLEQNGVQVITTYAASIEDVYEAIRLLGAVMGRDAEAEALIAEMQSVFAVVAEKSAALGTADRTVYFEVMPLEWGLWSAGSGTFMHELAALCGMQNAFADLDGWQPISQEQVIARNPDYIVLVTGMGDTAAAEVMGRAGWGDITAVRTGNVYNADAYMLTRPSPRLMDAVIDLFEFLHGIAWE